MKMRLLGICFILVALGGIDPQMANAKRNLPLLVTPEDLSSELDYERIVLRSWVVSGRLIMTRRLDGVYTELILGTQNGRKIMVVIDRQLYGEVVGKCLIVQGTYRQSGRFGGFLMPANFIIAELVEVDFTGEEGGCLTNLD